jgi:hydroxymethylglutaryl-CoA synthase
MTDRGILAYGSYIPRLRIRRETIAEAVAWSSPALNAQARGERSICGWDEDSLTMAVEAARDCRLDGMDAPDYLVLASTTLPFADRDNAAVVTEALDLPEIINTLDVSSSQRAGTAALANALGAATGSSLVIASECRETRPASPLEMQTGHGAAAVLAGNGKQMLARCLGASAVSRDLVDHYRSRSGRFDYTLEDRWVRDEGFFKIIPETVDMLLKQSGVTPDSIDHIIIPAPARVAKRLCKILGLDESGLADDLAMNCGHTGTAQPLLLLAATLEQATPGARILLVGFGQGADAMLFETTKQSEHYRPRLGVAGYLARRHEETKYLRYLSHRGLVEVDRGNRAEFDNRAALTTFYRKRDMVTAFKGGRCESCGTVQFPRAAMCVNPDCRARDTQTSVSLSGLTGRVKSFTEDWLAATPNPPLQYGIIELEGGANVMLEIADCEPGAIEVGTTVEMRFRIKAVDEKRDFTRYFWKPSPAENPSPVEEQ